MRSARSTGTRSGNTTSLQSLTRLPDHANAGAIGADGRRCGAPDFRGQRATISGHGNPPQFHSQPRIPRAGFEYSSATADDGAELAVSRSPPRLPAFATLLIFLLYCSDFGAGRLEAFQRDANEQILGHVGVHESRCYVHESCCVEHSEQRAAISHEF
jgi:hypothetical protein